MLTHREWWRRGPMLTHREWWPRGLFHKVDFTMSQDTQRFAATIGFFDGVHQGHRFLLGQLQEAAAARGLKSLVVTFDRHPREVVQSGWRPQLLTTLDEKTELLWQTGVDQVVVLPFDESLAALTARQFMSDVLVSRFHVALLLAGYDNRFGHGRTETFDDYVAYGHELGMEVVCARPLLTDGEADGAFSSSLVRRLLTAGDVARAAECLGRCYTISGQVVHGEHKGHGLGFPTANLLPGDSRKLIPARGCYAVEALLADGTRHRGMTNIGTRPTFQGVRQTLETHLFDFSEDIYGQPLTLGFVARLRDEQKFPSQDALSAQLSRDRQAAEKILGGEGWGVGG